MPTACHNCEININKRHGLYIHYEQIVKHLLEKLLVIVITSWQGFMELVPNRMPSHNEWKVNEIKQLKTFAKNIVPKIKTPPLNFIACNFFCFQKHQKLNEMKSLRFIFFPNLQFLTESNILSQTFLLRMRSAFSQQYLLKSGI